MDKVPTTGIRAQNLPEPDSAKSAVRKFETVFWRARRLLKKKNQKNLGRLQKRSGRRPPLPDGGENPRIWRYWRRKLY